MSLANNNFIKSITSSFPDELSPLPEMQPTTISGTSFGTSSGTSSGTSFLSNVTWETWIIIFLMKIYI